jgi:hypothetical protein
MVQYYRDMWAKRSEMLAPLSDLVGECGETKTTKNNKKSPWRWDPIHQKAFDDIKATITKEVVLAYPDFSKPFEIYTDASTKQLGAVLTQDNRPIAFFSRKLSEFSHPKRRECLGHDATYKHLFKRNAVIDQGLEIKLIENTLCDCKDSRLVIPKPLQRQAVLWHHHHLQYP